MTESLVDPWSSLIESYAPKPNQPQRSSSSGPAPRKVDADFVVQGLVDRGLPQHVAEGFAYNIEDESKFDAGINEISPLVKGSRGGYGLYQLTGPRRRQYEAFAKQQGVDFSDPDAQLDFLVHELQTTEKSAYNAMMQTSNSGEAGVAIVEKFLRPAAQHRKHRAHKYLQMGGTAAQPAQSTDFSRLWLSLGDDNG